MRAYWGFSSVILGIGFTTSSGTTMRPSVLLISFTSIPASDNSRCPESSSPYFFLPLNNDDGLLNMKDEDLLDEVLLPSSIDGDELRSDSDISVDSEMDCFGEADRVWIEARPDDNELYFLPEVFDTAAAFARISAMISSSGILLLVLLSGAGAGCASSDSFAFGDKLEGVV